MRTPQAQPYTLKLSEAELARYRDMASKAMLAELDTWAEAGINGGARVADIGCGPAVILAELADLVGPDGWVDGIERDPDARATAAAYLAARQVENARIVAGEALDTGLAPGTYDTVMMRHVLLHNGPNAVEILRHLATLLKPRGRLVLAETDLDAIRPSPFNADLDDERQRWHELMRRHGNDIQLGSHLGALVEEAGLEVVSLTGRYDILWMRDSDGARPPQVAARQAMIAEGLATEADGARWDAAMEARMANPEGAYVCLPMFHAVARRREARRDY